MGRDAVQRLAHSEALSHLVLETAPDAFIGIDMEGRIVTWNAKATQTFGWTVEEAIGCALWDKIIPPVPGDALEHFRETGENPIANLRMEVTARHRSGREFPVEVTISGPIQSDRGEFFGAFLRDVSDRREREQELRKAKEAAEAQAKTLHLLNGISRELNAVLNTDQLLRRIGELLAELIEYQTFSILLLDACGQNLKHRFSLSGSQVIAKPDIPINRGLVGYAARYRQPVVVPNVRADSRYIKFHEETCSELSVPLITKEKLIGVLDIENATCDYFRPSHVEAVMLLASQLAVALENAILYDRVSKQERQLNQDLNFARELQKRLQPSGMPPMTNAAVASLCRPARIIAGDMFDFGFYSKSKLKVGVLGDVSGKGAPAALYAALTSGIIRSLMERELGPAEMLSAVNQALMERPLDDRYIALMYGAWDDQRLVLRIANSGLPRPVYYRNGKMEIIDAIGIPLGMFAKADFDECVVEARPGDIFLFLSDGILEACNRHDDEFGYRGIEAALRNTNGLSAKEISGVLQRSLASHCGDLEAGDDQTLIVFKVAGTPGERN
jgi:sigma-B regulation protein RsbU (phosphoserine phosphatase)